MPFNVISAVSSALLMLIFAAGFGTPVIAGFTAGVEEVGAAAPAGEFWLQAVPPLKTPTTRAVTRRRCLHFFIRDLLFPYLGHEILLLCTKKFFFVKEKYHAPLNYNQKNTIAVKKMDKVTFGVGKRKDFLPVVQFNGLALIRKKRWKKLSTNMDSIILRPMVEEDLSTVLAIEEASFLSPWMQASFVYELHNPHGTLTVAEHQEQVLGYLCCWYVADEVQILDIAVHPNYRRRRIGERLLRYALETGRQRGAQSAHLEVRCSNSSAIALYQKFGFAEIAVRRRYYANGEDALLMSCQLSAQTGESEPA